MRIKNTRNPERERNHQSAAFTTSRPGETALSPAIIAKIAREVSNAKGRPQGRVPESNASEGSPAAGAS